jgi:hypothetical protein
MLNGEHGAIYKQIEENHKETLEHLIKVKSKVAVVETKIDIINNKCPLQERRINWLETKAQYALGGLGVLNLALAGLLIAKQLGIW